MQVGQILKVADHCAEHMTLDGAVAVRAHSNWMQDHMLQVAPASSTSQNASCMLLAARQHVQTDPS